MPRGYSELTPLNRVVAGDPIGQHTRVPRDLSPKRWSSDNIPKINIVAEQGDALRRGAGAEIPSFREWWDTLLPLEQVSLMLDEFGSRVYGGYHLKPTWCGELFCRAMGLHDQAARIAVWLRALTGLAVLAANGSTVRRIRDHGKPGDLRPIRCDGERMPDRGLACALTGKRSWCREDDEDDDRARDDDFRFLDFCDWSEWLAFVLGWSGLAPGNHFKVYRRELEQIARLHGVAPPWALTEHEVEVAKASMRGDQAARLEVASWLAGFACKPRFVLEVLADGTVRFQLPHLSGGSTSGCPFCELAPDGVQLFVCPNTGGRGERNAIEIDCELLPGVVRATSAVGTCQAAISTSPVVFRLEGGPEGIRVTLPVVAPPPPPPPEDDDEDQPDDRPSWLERMGL